MAGTISLQEALERKPNFNRFPWELILIDEEKGAWTIRNKFGSITPVVVCDDNGVPLFERPEYREAPNVNTVVYGMRDGKVHIGMLHEKRPHADNPLDPSDTKSLIFGQVPMGFVEKIIGKYESPEACAVREANEETGAMTILNITRPPFSFHNSNPTFMATWSELLFIEVDLTELDRIRPKRGELIYKAEFIPVPELLRRIQQGEHEGAVYRAGTSLSILMIFFAVFPQYFTS